MFASWKFQFVTVLSLLQILMTSRATLKCRHSRLSISTALQSTEWPALALFPGSPFLAGLPEKLATPRRDTPQKEIAPGSVGIGGAQTGIYPLRHPVAGLDRPHSA